MIELLDKLDQLNLHTLNEDWTQAIFYSEFLEFGDLPLEFENALENLDLGTILSEILQSFDTWLNEEPCTREEKSWAKLSHEIKHQELLAILAYYIDFGNKHLMNKENRNNAVLASRVYFKLLTIPGYKAYNIYHSQLFTNSLACLGYLKTMYCNEDNAFSTRELIREITLMLNSLKDFVFELKLVFLTLQLSPTDMNYEDILSNLIDVVSCNVIRKLNIDSPVLSEITNSVNDMVFILICNSEGVPNSEAIQVLFKCLLHKFIAASVDNKNANNIVRASYVSYTAVLLFKYGKAALSSYSTLLQHLCYTLDGLERAEVRTARISLVFGLMTLLPTKLYEDLIKWFLKLSTTSKVSHRQMALEILGKLLTNGAEEIRPNDNPMQNNEPEPSSSNIVSNEVLGNDVVDVNHEQMQTNPNTENNATEEVGQEPSLQTDTATLASADEMAKTKKTPHSEIVNAVYERLHDVSSSLRMRALTILTDCVSSSDQPTREAIKELNGCGEVPRLLAVAAKCACDERAVVRRAAAILVQRLLASADTVTSNDLAILVGLCRDASIIVRTSAITGLSELLMLKPNEDIVDAFLSGPMNQLSDPEAKVQELVMSQIHQILLERLRPCNVGVQEDILPWLFVAGIIRHNMRRHLQKACILLQNSPKSISSRVVEIVGSHLGVAGEARDLQSLVLLTGLARHFPDTDPSFLLRYYYRLDEDVQARDVRILGLIYELLTLWSKALTAFDRETLKNHLIRRLAVTTNVADDGCRTACATLAAHLDPENLQWAAELLQDAENRALNGGHVGEWLLAADLSLVAPTPPSEVLLQLLLQPLANPSSEMSEAELGACAAGAGRLCVRSREMAAEAAPALAALLRDNGAPLPARLNALLALTDVCVRYTCIVEPLLDSVCQCVNVETVPPLRRAAARALTRLLLAGYLRLRTPLYYRYCALLADEDHDVREPAEYYVSSCLTSDAIYHHFVDCVLHYNSEEAGAISFDARQLIYDVMLQRLSLVQKLNVQCRLAREVLAHAADLCEESGELPDTLHAALLDAITLLCGPRMRLPKRPQTTGETADIDDLQERVTTNIVSHKMKRTVAEVLVPAVLRLYSRMRTRGGQLAAYLVRIATDLLNDYRQEIEELIDNDEELVRRVHHFQQTIGLEPSFGNARNLVTSSAPPDPDTPRSQRKRTKQNRDTPRKRALRV